MEVLEDKITSPKKKAMIEIDELFKCNRDLHKEFLQYVRLYIQTRDENHRGEADKISMQIIKNLMRIEGIAKRIDDETSKNIAIRRMGEILNLRKGIGLKKVKI